MKWSKKLRVQFALQDGRELATLRDVRSFMLEIPELHQRNAHWKFTAEILIAAAGGSANMDELTAPLRRALAAEGML